MVSRLKIAGDLAEFLWSTVGDCPSIALYLIGTFAFSSSNQFRITLMCVTGGRGGGVRRCIA